MFENIQFSAPDAAYLAWLLFLATIVVILRRCIRYDRFNTFTICLPYLLLTNGLLTPLGIEVNSSITGYHLSDLAFQRSWIAVTLMYLGLPVGVIIANSFRKPNGKQHESRIICTTQRQGAAIFFVHCTLVLSLISLVQIFAEGLQLDLWSFLTGFDSYETYANHRYTFAAATTGWQYYFYSKLPYAIAPMALILLWNDVSIRTPTRWGGIALITFALIQTGHKLPIVMIAMTLFLSSYLIKHDMVVSTRSRLWASGAAVVLLFGYLPIEYLNQGEQTYSDALYWSFERLFVEPYRALQLYFEVYPEFHPFLYGLSARAVAAALDVRDYVSVSVFIPQVFLGVENTSYPAVFIGEAWADFGYVGVIGYSIAVGFMLQIYNIIYYNKPTHYVEDAALLIAVGISTIHLGHSNLVATCFTYGLATHVLFYGLLKRTGRRDSLTAPHSRRSTHRPGVLGST